MDEIVTGVGEGEVVDDGYVGEERVDGDVVREVRLSTGVVVRRRRIPWASVREVQNIADEDERDRAATQLIEDSVVDVIGHPEHGGFPRTFGDLDLSEIEEYGRLLLRDDPKSSNSGRRR